MDLNPYLKHLTCLYVEDDVNISFVFYPKLQKIFKEVYIAKNGKEGIDKYKKNRPDIILSDIKMPQMDGIEMTKYLKARFDDIYVIFLTAFTDMDYLKEAIDLGVEGYITKPIDKKKLIQKLNFIADIIKNKKELQAQLKIIKEMIEKEKEPMVLIKDEKIILSNKAFEEKLKIKNFDEFNEIINNQSLEIIKSTPIENYSLIKIKGK
jgi:YesN/AraC family two-component response regulator